jgi:nucleoside-diphosphate-sugar epimerase
MLTLVTGGGGFLGRYVVEKLLQRGDQVRVLGRRTYSDLEKLGVDCLQADIRDSKSIKPAFSGVDEVYHCAAIAGIWGRWQDYFDINVQGTTNVIEACVAAGVKRLIYTSSPSVVFDGKDQRGIDESQPYPKAWLTHYPHSKMLAERSVLKANGQNGLATVSLRPHLIWGPRDQHLIPRIVARAKAGKLMQVGDGSNLVDVIHVENAALAHLQAATSLANGGNCAGRVYFISQGQPVVLWDFINAILKGAGVAPVKKKISFRLAYQLGGCMEAAYKLVRKNEEPRMTRFLACQLATDHYYNIDSARRDFGFSPTITTEQGLADLFSTEVPGAFA